MKNLFEILRSNNVEFIKSNIIEFDKNILNENNQNLLQEAITTGNNEIAKLLIENKININHQDITGKTALHYCALYRNIEIAKLILECKGDININDKYGNNALWVAVFNARGQYEIVEFFISNLANPINKNDSNKSALDFAIQINDTKLQKLLTR